MAIIKLCDQEIALTAAEIINDGDILPFFLTVTTSFFSVECLQDSGTKYCGKVEYNRCELYLGTENVGHSKTKA